MSKLLCFAKRNTKEILRDPISAFFGVAFPIVLLLLLTLIDRSIPAQAQMTLFHIETLCPGIGVFSLSFLALFTAILISKDRGSSLLQRLYTTPLTPMDFILGYTLPIIPIAVAQCVICYIAAIILGLEITLNILYAIFFVIPVSVLYIALGLLCGSLFTDKQVGGICGALLTNLSAWLSGVWFDLNLVGGVFQKIAYALPFVHAVEMERAALAGNFAGIFPHIWWVLGYAAVLLVLAVMSFLRQMKKQ